MRRENLNSFLEFGYFLDYKNQSYKIDLSNTHREEYINSTEEELVDEGIRVWEETINSQFNLNDKHVVPLSGGIDSRAILATLLKFTEAKNIYTFTYGTPGTLDFEIGNQIAKKVGTNHHKLPLTEYSYQLDDLIDISKRVDHQTALFMHGPVDVIDKEFKNSTVWSGAIIDVFFGRHQHNKKANNWNDAILNSFKENQYVKSIKLSNCDYDDYKKLVEYDTRFENDFELEHIIDLMNRQTKYIAPHVLMKGLNYKVLFNSTLSDFANSVPYKYRENQFLYKKMFMKAYPELFSLRTKSNLGLSLDASSQAIFLKRVQNKVSRTFGLSKNSGVNYLDFNEKIRTKKDLRDIICSSVIDLKKRDIIDWINIDSILSDHLSGKADFADALIVLASLEIHIKSGLKL
jgi:hypothetical protein